MLNGPDFPAGMKVYRIARALIDAVYSIATLRGNEEIYAGSEIGRHTSVISRLYDFKKYIKSPNRFKPTSILP